MGWMKLTPVIEYYREKFKQVAPCILVSYGDALMRMNADEVVKDSQMSCDVGWIYRVYCEEVFRRFSELPFSVKDDELADDAMRLERQYRETAVRCYTDLVEAGKIPPV